MDLLLSISDLDVGFDTPIPTAHKERRAARGVVFDHEGKIALLHATKNGYHKLPGGGIEGEEDPISAFKRETLEEIGCAITDIRPLGMIEEYRNKFELHQISDCYAAQLEGEKGVPHLEPDEIAEGFETVWVELPDALQILNAETTNQLYESRFIVARDIAILKAATKQ